MSPTRVDLIPPPTDQTVYKKRVSFNRYMPESYLKEFLKNKFPNKVQGKDWNYKYANDKCTLMHSEAMLITENDIQKLQDKAAAEERKTDEAKGLKRKAGSLLP